MDYITIELTYYNGFTIEMVCKNGLELVEQNCGYYSMILFSGCSLNLIPQQSEDADGVSALRMVSGSGVLLLSQNHGLSGISLVAASPDAIIQTLIFSPRGINTNFEQFPDTFEYNILTQLSDGFACVPLADRMLETFLHHFDRINEEMNLVQSEFWPCLARSYLLELFLLLSRNDFLTQRDADSKDTVNRILEYFQNSYIEKIRLDDLACKFATNRTTINAEFNRNFGTSAMNFLNRIRIQNAQLLLSNTGLRISDIAERTGFTDEAYFSRAFKKQTGKSPREYRLSIPFPYSKGNWCGYHL
ncbi:MAG: AraC family transcriptional regulator [Treponemataceae bacterium]|nr:AraC family transcriptional regulator [Treponemataceae bacterium]